MTICGIVLCLNIHQQLTVTVEIQLVMELSNMCFADVHMLLRKMTICHKFCNESKWSYTNSTSGKLLIINEQLLHEVEFKLFHLYGLQNL